MKKIIYTLIISTVTFGSLTSCDVLNQYPHNGVSRDNLTDEDLELLYTGLYCYSQYKPSFEGYFQNDMAGGDFTRGGGASFATPELWIKDAILPTSGWSATPWIGYYAWLYQVNEFITAAENRADDPNIREMLGGAYFFRGLIYYNLVSKYRNVQILRQATNEPIANTNEAEGWAFVEENLNNAISMCPNFVNKNYVSVQAAKALMARTLLAQGKKAEAADLAVELINDPAFGLEDFSMIFRGQDNKEEIFTFINSGEESGINFASQFYQPATTYVPTKEIIELYTSNDKRMNISVWADGDATVLNKYNNVSSTNPIIITRLAEMYLIAAEGKGIAGGGLKYLNTLREKRGLPAVNVSNDTDLLTSVLHERRLEFLGEGFRWFDLVRTGRYTEELDLPEKYTVFPIPQRERDLNPNLAQNELWK